MAFDSLENDNEYGMPVRLYRFDLGGTVWRYSTTAQDLVYGGNVWSACAISDDGVKLSGDSNTDALNITAPNDIGPAVQFLGTPPSMPIAVTIFNYHRSDNQAVVEYVGEVSQCDQPVPGTAVLTCESLFASMDRDGLRLSWQRACPYALYDVRTCGVNKAAFAVQVDLTSAFAGLVTGAGFGTKPTGYFNGGFLTWQHPLRGMEFRAIEEHVGDQVRMFGDSDGLYYGLRVTAYPGCNRTPTHCKERFSNYPNYGGCEDLDGTNPFDGNPVFN